MEKLLKLSPSELAHQVDSLADALTKMADKSAGGQRAKVQFLNYLATICSNGRIGAVVAASKMVRLSWYSAGSHGKFERFAGLGHFAFRGE